MPERRIYYGGQAVLEGVAIRGPHTMAVACRRPDGEIVVRNEALGGVYVGFLRRAPLLRGVIVMWETLALGMRSLIFSSNVALGEDEREISPGAIWGTVLVALALVATLFFAGPLLLSRWLEDTLKSNLLVVIVSVVVFAALGTPELWLRVVSRVALIPVIAAIAYELIRLGAAFESSRIV